MLRGKRPGTNGRILGSGLQQLQRGDDFREYQSIDHCVMRLVACDVEIITININEHPCLRSCPTVASSIYPFIWLIFLCTQILLRCINLRCCQPLGPSQFGICVPPTSAILAVPRYRLNTYGRRAFSVAGATIWNSLPDFIRDPTISAESSPSLKFLEWPRQQRHHEDH